MIAAWIIYCALWALWLSAIAWMTERVLLNARGPVRMVWLSAMALSVLGPVVGYSLPRSKLAAPMSVAMASVQSSNTPIVMRASASSHRPEIGVRMRAAVARLDRPLAVAWVASMFGWLLYIGGGVLRLRIVRRRWRHDVVGGTAVMISEDTGPALVGVFNCTIVIPAWALDLEPDALALMLRHELEHRAAGDTRTLAVAQALLVLMPWNPLMWWQLRRLRLAIELDCDARVLRRTSDVAAYGRLLLEFGRPSRDLRVAGAALADHRASQLETRIRRMTQRRPVRRGQAVATSLIAIGLAIAIGCQLPTPPAPKPTTPAEALSEHDWIQLKLDSAILANDSADQAAVRTLRLRLGSPASGADEIEGERLRRIAETQRALDSANRVGPMFGRPRNWHDSLPLKLFEAQIGFAEARDSLTRKLWEARLDTARWVFDSTVHTWPGQRVPMSYMERVADSLTRELMKLRMTMTEQHPQVRALLAQLASIEFPDSIAALEPSPGCTSGTGEPVVKLIVPNEAALRSGVIVVRSEASTSRGALVEFDAGMTCSGPGELRLYGRGAFDGRSIVVRSTLNTSIVVVTGSGRVLVGPIALENAPHRYQLTWSPR